MATSKAFSAPVTFIDNEKGDENGNTPNEPTEMKETYWKIVDWEKPYVEPKRKFYFDTVNGVDWVTVQWGGYDYDIQMRRIPDPLALLQWLAHMGEKEWERMTSAEIRAFIEKVCKRKGWNLWAKH